MALKLVKFNKKIHKRDEFSCESSELETYLKRQVSQDLRKSLCQCFVVVDSTSKVIAFSTLSPGGMPGNISGIPYAQVGGVLIGRLAVDKDHAGKGIGTAILMKTILEAYSWLDATSGSIVYLEAKDHGLKKYYQDRGFTQVSDESLYMYLTKKEIEKSLLNIVSNNI